MPGPMRGPRGGQTTERAKDFKKTTKKLIKAYLAKYKIPTQNIRKCNHRNL